MMLFGEMIRKKCCFDERPKSVIALSHSSGENIMIITKINARLGCERVIRFLAWISGARRLSIINHNFFNLFKQQNINVFLRYIRKFSTGTVHAIY